MKTPRYMQCEDCPSYNIPVQAANCPACGGVNLRPVYERESAEGTVSPSFAIGQLVTSAENDHAITYRVLAIYGRIVTVIRIDGSAHATNMNSADLRIVAAEPSPSTNVAFAPEAPRMTAEGQPLHNAFLQLMSTREFLRTLEEDIRRIAGAPILTRLSREQQNLTDVIHALSHLEPVRESTPATVPAADPNASECRQCECQEFTPEADAPEFCQCGCAKHLHGDSDEDQTPSASEEQERWR